jgi:hypothetical protein
MSSRPRAAWVRVLEQIEATLAQSLAVAADPPPAGPAVRKPDEAPLRVLDERLARWQACLEQARGNATEAGDLLTGGCEDLQNWLGELAGVRQRLADRVQQTV